MRVELSADYVGTGCTPNQVVAFVQEELLQGTNRLHPSSGPHFAYPQYMAFSGSLGMVFFRIHADKMVIHAFTPWHEERA
jgi:hypothetical protein